MTLKHTLLINAVIWAAMILATAFIVSGSDLGNKGEFSLTLLQITGWYMMDMFLRGKVRSPKSDGACALKSIKKTN
ncbi:hypothetical protein MNBD_ALPHA02-479 [hydrothermal vent metagenome]|uniref:Uncharacterized protein n=1 Tax=hydrothermal vent metagenome TaxID=652676 RepID=A0A3B0RMG3_9ZZZZ